MENQKKRAQLDKEITCKKKINNHIRQNGLRHLKDENKTKPVYTAVIRITESSRAGTSSYMLGILEVFEYDKIDLSVRVLLSINAKRNKAYTFISFEV